MIDADAEIEILRNGVVTGTVNGVPTKVVGKPNTWLYSYSGVTFAAGDVVIVRFKAGSFSDKSGATNSAEDERFFVVDNTPGSNPNGKPGPIAALASPLNGQHRHGGRAQRPPLPRHHVHQPRRQPDQQGDSIEDAGPPFMLSGTGTATSWTRRLRRARLVGLPLLVSGSAANATTAHLPLLPQGQGAQQRERHVHRRRGHAHLRRQLVHRRQRGHPGQHEGRRWRPGRTVAGRLRHPVLHPRPVAPGRRPRPAALPRPAHPAGPDHRHRRLRVRRRHAGADHRARRSTGPPSTSAGRPNSTAGTSQAQADRRQRRPGRRAGHLRPRRRRARPAQRQRAGRSPTGKWGAAGRLPEADVPNVATLTADGMVFGYDPATRAAGRRSCSRIDNATITFPTLRA